MFPFTGNLTEIKNYVNISLRKLDEKEGIMVIVKVWCLPKMTTEKLESLFEDIFNVLKANARITWVENEKDELILFPPDKWQYGLGKEILIEVQGLPAGVITKLSGKEIEIMMRKLGKQLIRVLKDRFPKANVACHVWPPDPRVMVC